MSIAGGRDLPPSPLDLFCYLPFRPGGRSSVWVSKPSTVVTELFLLATGRRRHVMFTVPNYGRQLDFAPTFLKKGTDERSSGFGSPTSLCGYCTSTSTVPTGVRYTTSFSLTYLVGQSIYRSINQ